MPHPVMPHPARPTLRDWYGGVVQQLTANLK